MLCSMLPKAAVPFDECKSKYNATVYLGQIRVWHTGGVSARWASEQPTASAAAINNLPLPTCLRVVVLARN